MKTLVSLAALLFGLTACASAGMPVQHARTSATPLAAAPNATAPSAGRPGTQPGAAESAGPLFAVLEGAPLDIGAEADTVAIVGLDGHAIAKAKFQPRKGPFLGNAADMLQSEAQVGKDGVYYIDGNGVVRLLKPSGDVQTIAIFPMTPEQHEAWYAVSPDGSQILAGVLTAPALGPPAGGAPWPSLVGGWKFDLEKASAGGPTRVLRHIESSDMPGQSWQAIFPVGWTEAGPVAMVGAPLTTQNQWWGGPLFTIDEAGQPGTRVGGADCTAARVLSSGLVPCVMGSGSDTSVQDSSGRVVWRPGLQGFNALGLRLAPDAGAIAIGRSAANHTKQVMLPDEFQAEGWLDSQTVVGRRSGGELSYVRLDRPGTVHSLGFKGDFVGMLPGH